MIKKFIIISLLLFSNLSIATSLDVEEARVKKAENALPKVAQRYNTFMESLTESVKNSTTESQISQSVADLSHRLWQQAVRDVQSGSNDDRPLYWSRLTMRRALKQLSPNFKMLPWQREVLLRSVETATRGLNDVSFSEDSQIKILLTGFDPFFLDRDISQSNPSGLAALALDGHKFNVHGKQAQIETVMIPVRFKDFDDGMIESILTPVYRDNLADMVFTVSMGRSDFDLERFPGRNRSANAPDNLNVYTGATKRVPKAPMLNGSTLNGNEFIEFTLPVAAMQAVKGKWKVNDNANISTLKKGEFIAESLYQLRDETSVTGSGGGYLSNEISYRALRLMHQYHSNIPVGHIHTPRVKGHDPMLEAAIVQQIKKMVISAAKAY
ncbi:hypothetical protein D5R81_03075 [Parashewanella spongiae]|uniref:Pyrrolidone-carboxylate peptidase n=1 Tax=Parashewanella spongiae TaxID=342950 RepID=A0A3A6UMH0_9GAMM|nr:hypothetical protein [Parashewanella spongiae]MCL1076950.1 hypothetical protein [Parashewanella spongiae]RJY18934.1 hypothetical protein D5R81_03075 [Parashewanella spongiae]